METYSAWKSHVSYESSSTSFTLFLYCMHYQIENLLVCGEQIANIITIEQSHTRLM